MGQFYFGDSVAKWISFKSALTPFEQKDCVKGEPIFDKYKFQVCRFTEFESRLVQLNDQELCHVADFLHLQYLESRFNRSQLYADHVITKMYVDTLLMSRAHRVPAIADTRSEIAGYSRMFPELNSEHLAAVVEASGVRLPVINECQ
ncbi:hypothetical protein [Enterovibrio nigricans]|uniref:hypothetical protein n=1 Tax=Enterovibrio nigricans TaxID=504469 RepID=UPI000999BFFE|nr:hypothetical protein [Enterovibrio nigricans]PKF48620.1 hypothetical protein AT251_24730 [Enterovibrio nigricans]